MLGHYLYNNNKKKFPVSAELDGRVLQNLTEAYVSNTPGEIDCVNQ